MANRNRTSLLASDSKVTRFFWMAWQLLIVNMLTLLCCIPIITAGASLTAMYYVLLKLVRGEESYVSRDFFEAFKSELKQGTLLWLVKLAFLIPLVVDLLMIEFAPDTMPRMMMRIVLIAGFAVMILLAFVLPLESHFSNTIGGTLQNSLRLGISRLPRAFVMTFIYLIPAWLLVHVLILFPMIIMFGISLPGFICTKLFDPVFKQLEPQLEEPEEQAD